MFTLLERIRCYVFNRHDVMKFEDPGQLNYRLLLKGDYGDEYGHCMCCSKLVHRDAHMYGDGIWRRAQGYRNKK